MTHKKPEDYFGRALIFIRIIVIMLLLAGLLYAILKPRRAHSAECDPVTLHGQVHSAWPEKDGGLELLAVVWLIELPEEKFEAVRLLFLRREVFAANFYNNAQRQTVTQIKVLRRGCRFDGQYVNTLVGPPELTLLQ